jgi:hypothetical protein
MSFTPFFVLNNTCLCIYAKSSVILGLSIFYFILFSPKLCFMKSSQKFNAWGRLGRSIQAKSYIE